MAKEYKCICGRVFTSSQGFNGHRAHCEMYLKQIGKFETRKQAKAIGAAKARKAQTQQMIEKQSQKLAAWLASKPKCETCGKIMTELYGSGRFCCRSCANKRNLTADTKLKISKSLDVFHAAKDNSEVNLVRQDTAQKRHLEFIVKYNLNPNYCSICGKVLPFELRFRKTCSDDCLHTAFTNAGLTASAKLEKRSKNEIAFCILCENYFGKEFILHNEPMFNGWDADIIIPKYKLAILWNGPWHYRKVTKSHNLKQVQIRDKIKQDQIKLCGFTPYVIKDNSKFNLNKVNSEFNKLIEYIRSL